jgi:hypothetical protein
VSYGQNPNGGISFEVDDVVWKTADRRPSRGQILWEPGNERARARPSGDEIEAVVDGCEKLLA